MELGIIGLGRMGSNMAQRLMHGGHRIVAYDVSMEAVETISAQGAVESNSIADLVSKLEKPCAIWIMVPSGEVTEKTIMAVSDLLDSGDVIIDGGNSYYKDSTRRAGVLAEKGIFMLDAGTSGGVWGLEEGYCMMVGGDSDVFRRLESIFRTLAPGSDRGYGHVGPSGAGHFVKMVHNGIEYGMMQAYAEGFELMQAKGEFQLNLTQIARIWRHGSVVRSWLLDLTALALENDPQLKAVKAYVEDTGEGRWTVQESIEMAVPVPVITLALQARFRSRREQPFGAKLLAALRQQFGGHAVKQD